MVVAIVCGVCVFDSFVEGKKEKKEAGSGAGGMSGGMICWVVNADAVIQTKHKDYEG